MRSFGRGDRASSSLELIDQVVHINRVTKVVKGGKNFSFSALVVVGDGNGRVGYGSGKAKRGARGHQEGHRDRQEEHDPGAAARARRFRTRSPGASAPDAVLLKPASEGTGVIAGGAGARGARARGHPGHPDQVAGLDQPPQRGQGDVRRAHAPEAAASAWRGLRGQSAKTSSAASRSRRKADGRIRGASREPRRAEGAGIQHGQEHDKPAQGRRHRQDQADRQLHRLHRASQRAMRARPRACGGCSQRGRASRTPGGAAA